MQLRHQMQLIPPQALGVMKDKLNTFTESKGGQVLEEPHPGAGGVRAKIQVDDLEVHLIYERGDWEEVWL